MLGLMVMLYIATVIMIGMLGLIFAMILNNSLAFVVIAVCIVLNIVAFTVTITKYRDKLYGS